MTSPEQRLQELRTAESCGAELDTLPFWRPRATDSGEIGPGCLSQWWPAPFTVDEVSYPTAEHWMMAGKARLFDDPQQLAVILSAPNPRAAQVAGRRVRGFDEQRWRAARYDLVVAGNLAKFGQHPRLRAFLLGTGAQILVEASPYDRIWGVGLRPTSPDVARPSAWRGLNLLGFALMEVRAALREVRAALREA